MIASVLKKSLVNKYLEACREIAGSEQVPVVFSRKETMTKYDPDRVQDYFDQVKSDQNAILKSEESKDDKVAPAVTKDFLASSLWLCK